jgi:hypothetical protein
MVTQHPEQTSVLRDVTADVEGEINNESYEDYKEGVSYFFSFGADS